MFTSNRLFGMCRPCEINVSQTYSDTFITIPNLNSSKKVHGLTSVRLSNSQGHPGERTAWVANGVHRKIAPVAPRTGVPAVALTVPEHSAWREVTALETIDAQLQVQRGSGQCGAPLLRLLPSEVEVAAHCETWLANRTQTSEGRPGLREVVVRWFFALCPIHLLRIAQAFSQWHPTTHMLLLPRSQPQGGRFGRPPCPPHPRGLLNLLVLTFLVKRK